MDPDPGANMMACRILAVRLLCAIQAPRWRKHALFEDSIVEHLQGV